MILQDINLTTQNQHIVPTKPANGICIHVQESEATVTEAKSTIDHADGEIDTTSANVVANGPVLINNIFPPISTSHGISASWSSRIL